MTLAELSSLAAEFTRRSPLNTLPAEQAMRPKLAGLRFYDAPVLGCANADDEYLAALPASAAGLERMLTPREWLPGAKTVISFFLPFTERVRRANAADLNAPVPEWLHARIEGQAFLAALTAHLCERLADAGHACVAPLLDSRFWSVAKAPAPGRAPEECGFTSNWSERHAAYACGLGTFSLSRGLITEKGTAGRFGSLVTALELPATPRAYSGLTDYCTLCGVCARNCPVGAISPQTGKDQVLCDQFVNVTSRELRAGYYGCGKCQVRVPCEGRRP